MTKGDDSTDEIEITPEMIEVGVGALCAYDYRFESMEEAVCRIFTVMMERYQIASLPDHFEL